MESKDKEVYFDKYCRSCKHWLTEHYEEPCDDCLQHPSNADSHKPYRWEESK